ncbi:MAG: hypothetical protein SH821_16825 [Phototrophicales bacterium]|nr:hypothetical protein [Phototrophicales bacterium]
MSIEGIILSIVIFAIGILWLAFPFVTKNQSHKQLSKQQDRQSLLNAYERLLARLSDLDEDYNLGKMPDADYLTERQQLAERGASLLAKIESTLVGTMPDATPTSLEAEADTKLDAAIESAIANYIATTQEEKEHAPSR